MTNNSCGFSKKEFKDKTSTKLEEWFGGKDKFEIMFQWFDDDVSYVCAKTEGAMGTEWTNTLYFLRLFEIGGNVQISQDKTTYL